jgi:hypothetical protein
VSKKSLATSTVLPALGLLLALAGPRPLAAAAPATATPRAKVHGVAVSGRVSKVDGGAKTFSVRETSGREVALAWTSATKITGGDLKVGELVTLRYLDKDRKHIATTIHVGPIPPAKARPATPSVSPSPAAR